MDQLLTQLGIQYEWRGMMLIASLIFIRMIMITTTIPFLTGRPVPAQVKIGLAVALLIFLFPYLSENEVSVQKFSAAHLLLLYLKESFYGLAIGFAGSIVFHGFHAAGSMIDSQRGAAQARLLIPQFGQESSLFGQFQFLLGVTLFLVLGGHLLFFKVVVQSYDLLPLFDFPQKFPELLSMVDEFIRLTGIVLLLSVQLCAPVLLAIFVADVILGMISKTAPAINVWELGFVIRGVLGVVIVFISIGLIVTQMEKMSFGMIGQVEKVINLLGKP